MSDAPARDLKILSTPAPFFLIHPRQSQIFVSNPISLRGGAFRMVIHSLAADRLAHLAEPVARPTGMTTSPGPGVTSMMAPISTTVAPTTPITIRRAAL